MHRINMGVHSMKNLEDTETFLLDQDATRKKAAQYLLTKTSDEVLAQIREGYEEKGMAFFFANHFTLGISVRNLLRKGGFGDEKFLMDMDDVWPDIVIEMLKEADKA